MEKVLQVLSENLNILYYLVSIAILIIIAVFTKNYKALRMASEEGIRASAKYFNSDERQKKLENAVIHLQNRVKDLPWLVRILLENFGTKAVLVTIIEWFYKLIKEKLKLEISEEEMNIKGNEVKKN
jgi:hypothetical protein